VLTVPLFPCVADGRADEDGGDGEGKCRGQAEGDDAPDDAAEALLGEDLQVEEEEGDLDETKSREVGDFANPEVLRWYVSRRTLEVTRFFVPEVLL
jgi:hypothetical protein